jgi:hypothetical protein
VRVTSNFARLLASFTRAWQLWAQGLAAGEPANAPRLQLDLDGAAQDDSVSPIPIRRLPVYLLEPENGFFWRRQ